MGVIRDLRRGDSRSHWEDVFGGRPVPRRERPYGSMKPTPGGSWGRGIASANESSFRRLLEALRSNAPGGWSDDRYEQTLRHFIGITYVAIHRICVQLGRAEFQVFKEDSSRPDGRRPVTREDEAWELVELLKRPNGQDTFGKLMYRWGQQKRLTGTSLIWMVPNRLHRPHELYSIPTALAIPQPVVNPDFPHGFYRVQPVYPYGPFSTFPSPASAVGAPLPAEWVLRSQYPHPLLRYEGYSPLTGMRLHIDALEMIDRARHYMMRRGIYPSAVLNSADVEGATELDDDVIDRIRAEFESEHQGPENMGRLLVAYAGWKLEQWGSPPSEMAFDSGWDQLTNFILGGGFGITKPAAGMIEDSSYSTLFATMKQLHLVTLEPECEEIAAELTRHLACFWGDDVSIDIRVPRIDDHEVRFSKISTLMSAKAITKNEVRLALGDEFGLEQWSDGRGEEIAGEQSPQDAQAMQQATQPPQQGAPGGPGMGDEMASEGAGGSGDPVADLLAGLGGDDSDPSESGRPTPGGLGEGSLGPRMGTPPGTKGLNRLVGRLRKVVTNGRGH